MLQLKLHESGIKCTDSILEALSTLLFVLPDHIHVRKLDGPFSTLLGPFPKARIRSQCQVLLGSQELPSMCSLENAFQKLWEAVHKEAKESDVDLRCEARSLDFFYFTHEAAVGFASLPKPIESWVYCLLWCGLLMLIVDAGPNLSLKLPAFLIKAEPLQELVASNGDDSLRMLTNSNDGEFLRELSRSNRPLFSLSIQGISRGILRLIGVEFAYIDDFIMSSTGSLTSYPSILAD